MSTALRDTRPISDDVELRDLFIGDGSGVHARIISALKRIDITTVGGLVSLSETGLNKLANIGPCCIHEARKVLEAYGRNLPFHPHTGDTMNIPAGARDFWERAVLTAVSAVLSHRPMQSPDEAAQIAAACANKLLDEWRGHFASARQEPAQ